MSKKKRKITNYVGIACWIIVFIGCIIDGTFLEALMAFNLVICEIIILMQDNRIEQLEPSLRAQKKQNRPLTLEELSQIKKEPVWVSGHGWQIAHGVTDVYGPLRLIVGQRDTINIEDYGNSIVAYRCKPEEHDT